MIFQTLIKMNSRLKLLMLFENFSRVTKLYEKTKPCKSRRIKLNVSLYRFQSVSLVFNNTITVLKKMQFIRVKWRKNHVHYVCIRDFIMKLKKH